MHRIGFLFRIAPDNGTGAGGLMIASNIMPLLAALRRRTSSNSRLRRL